MRFSPFEETKLAVATSQNFGIIGNGRQYVLQVRESHSRAVCSGVAVGPQACCGSVACLLPRHHPVAGSLQPRHRDQGRWGVVPPLPSAAALQPALWLLPLGTLPSAHMCVCVCACVCVPQMGPSGIQEVRVFDSVDGLYDCAWSEENENILVSASGDGSIKVWARGDGGGVWLAGWLAGSRGARGLVAVWPLFLALCRDIKGVKPCIDKLTSSSLPLALPPGVGLGCAAGGQPPQKL